MTQLAGNIFRLFVPFAGEEPDGLHVYLIRGTDRHLLIDCGLNTDACEQALLAQLRELDVCLPDVDLLITHMHVDHSGLMGRLSRLGSRILTGEGNRPYLLEYEAPLQEWSWLLPNNRWAGTSAEYALAPADHIADLCRPTGFGEIRPLKWGEHLQYGNYVLEVLDLSGHCAAQIGLWCGETGMLFSADHVLSGSFPNITAWNLQEDFVQYYLDNLTRILQLPICSLLPSHGAPITDIAGRIEETRQHILRKRERFREIVYACEKPVTAFETAAAVKRHGKLTDLHAAYRWFICSDTLAYLQHLAFRGELSATHRDGTMYYAKSATLS